MLVQWFCFSIIIYMNVNKLCLNQQQIPTSSRHGVLRHHLLQLGLFVLVAHCQLLHRELRTENAALTFNHCQPLHRELRTENAALTFNHCQPLHRELRTENAAWTFNHCQPLHRELRTENAALTFNHCQPLHRELRTENAALTFNHCQPQLTYFPALFSASATGPPTATRNLPIFLHFSQPLQLGLPLPAATYPFSCTS